MHISLHKFVLIISIAVLGMGCSQQLSFENDIKPILTAYCLDCHDEGGEGFAKSGFSVKDYENVMKGTKFGAVIVPGDSASSTLYQLISHATDVKIQMPPHHENALPEGRRESLPDEQFGIIRKWIDQGARNN